MPRITHVLRYLVATYPYPEDLSWPTVMRLVYLADWEAARIIGSPLTRTPWILECYGPMNAAVWSAMNHDRMLALQPPHPSVRTVPRLTWQGPTPYHPRLTPAHRTILDAIIGSTQNLTFVDLLALVYRTTPVATGVRGTILPLRQIAQRLASSG